MINQAKRGLCVDRQVVQVLGTTQVAILPGSAYFYSIAAIAVKEKVITFQARIWNSLKLETVETRPGNARHQQAHGADVLLALRILFQVEEQVSLDLVLGIEIDLHGRQTIIAGKKR